MCDDKQDNHRLGNFCQGSMRDELLASDHPYPDRIQAKLSPTVDKSFILAKHQQTL